MRITSAILMVLSATFLFGQDIAGNWTGWLSQESGGVFPKYYFEMKLNTNGDSVSGLSYDHIQSGVVEHWCTFTVEGNFSADAQTFTFLETGEVESVTTGMTPPRGCIIQGSLQYSASDDMEYLIGDWSGVIYGEEETPCPPGRIYLERIRIIKDTIDEPPVFPDVFEDRDVVYDKNYNVWNEEIELVIWDNNIIDYDIISLSFNGEWILKDYTLTDERITVSLTCRTEGENVLILHAENEGEIPPNTAAIRVYDGKRTKMFTLSSDMDTSGALKITHTPRD